MATTFDTTCTRCKGKGYGTWYQEMGRCHGCNGTGKRLTPEQRLERGLRLRRAHLAELLERGTELAARKAKGEAGGRGWDRWLDHQERELVSCRTAFANVRAAVRRLEALHAAQALPGAARLTCKAVEAADGSDLG